MSIPVCHRCYQQIDVHLFYDIEMQDEDMVAKAGETLHYRAIYYRTIARPTCARCRHRIKAMERLIRTWQRKRDAWGWDIQYNTPENGYPAYEKARAPLLGRRVRILPLSDGSPSGLCGQALSAIPYGSRDGTYMRYSVEIEDLSMRRSRPLIREFVPEELAEL